jgi:alpha-amylase
MRSFVAPLLLPLVSVPMALTACADTAEPSVHPPVTMPLAPPDDDIVPGDTALAALEREQAQRAAALSALPGAKGWTERVLYFALLDRFADGDADNLSSHGDSECNRPWDAHAYQGGDLAGLKNALGYIDDLGPDALWVSPLYKGVPTKQGDNCGFPGYWVNFADPYQLELDPRYGTATLFDEVIDQAHALDMRVMLDMVVNHAGYGAPLVEQHPDWFNDPATCGHRGQPDIDCPLAGLPDFDHENTAAADYLIDAHLQWVNRFAFDGIRMDTVKHVTPAYFSQWMDAMRDSRPDLFMVGELLDEHSFWRYGRYLDAGFDGLFNFPLRQGLIASFARGDSVDVAAGRMEETLNTFGLEQTRQLVNLLDNHDVRRFTEEIPPWVSPDEARRRYLLAMTALLTLPGIPQIYYGNEVGMYGGHDPDNRRFLPQWVFSEQSRQQSFPGFLEHPNVVFDTTQRLVKLRQRLAPLKRGDYRELWRQNGAGNNNVWAYSREADGQAVIVAFNNGFLATEGAVGIPVRGAVPAGTRLTDVLGTAGVDDLTVDGDKIWLSLPAQSAVVLAAADAPHPLEQQAEVTFTVEADTYWGQNVYVTGSALDLGGWTLDRALPLSPSGCSGSRCTWSAAVALPTGADVDFKLVKIDGELAVAWEPGFNRSLTVGGDTEVIASWP